MIYQVTEARDSALFRCRCQQGWEGMIVVVQRGVRCHCHESMSVWEGVVESLKWRCVRLAVLVLSLLLDEASQCTVSASVL